MNEITTKILDNFSPVSALIVYENGLNDKYIEVCDINKHGRLGAAKPVSIDFMISLCQSFSETHSRTPSGAMPGEMLYCDTRAGKETYVWFNPPMKRRMYFKESLNIKNAEYNVPGVVYVVQGGDLDIYAYKGKPMTTRTKLFKAPFFNVTDSSVCLGNDKEILCNNPTFSDLMEHWEKRFWNSEFSHLGGNANPTKSNLVTVTKSAKNKPFDETQLVSFPKLTLEKLLNEL